MIKQILKSKTMIFAILLAVLSVLQASMEVFTPFLSSQGVGLLGLVIGLAIAILRVLTTAPLEDK